MNLYTIPTTEKGSTVNEPLSPADQVIPLQYHNPQGRVTIDAIPGQPASSLGAAPFAIEPVHDSYGRRINYLRISLTDVCNLRCVYCMPEDMTFRPRQELMSDEEIITLVRVGASLGVDKIRLTG
ncbi:MAG: radical SAM protein, partial [Caldilineaceae bacterium]|nr:radical SAM protein [Caldilineaceae bacterium]